ncbi:MAG TPA: PQQ-binding-like beta-propeller repeat protein [Steroidobacteraceae bacterium]
MRFSFWVCWLFLGALSACGGGGGSAGSGSTSSPPSQSGPSIVTQPANQSAVLGQTATFSVTASGSSLSYQWNKNGSAVSGATSASYTTPATVDGDNGAKFTVVVSNSGGSVTSAAATLTVTAASGSSGVDATTYKYDVSRSGANLAETHLTLTNVNSKTFGLLRNLRVDGKVDAQPLYVSHLAVLGGTHNVVFVATEHDSVYAFDADSGSNLWQVSLLKSGESTSDDHGCSQVTPEIGITSTPVIDKSAGTHGTLFVVGMSKDSGGSYHQRLHALDLATGAELLSGPVDVSGSVSTQGGGSNSFSAGQYEERAALLLSGGTVYLSFTSHCDSPPYSGWVMAYGESSLAQTSLLNVGSNSSAGPAIWMSGGGPAADSAGNVYLLTANGAFETTLDANGFPNLGDFGNSFVKIGNSGGKISIVDYFALMNEVSESNGDIDLGSGGIMLLPDLKDSGGATQHLMVGAGKDGNVYVVSRDNLGKFNASKNNIFQQATGIVPGGVFATPAYFNGTVYYGDRSGTLKAFAVSNALLATQPSSQSTTQFAFPGTAPAISANGAQNGIVWAHENLSTAVLHAYDASNLAHEIYNSTQAASNRDAFGTGNKFITPVIADGKVMVGTTNSVAVFGILP